MRLPRKKKKALTKRMIKFGKGGFNVKMNTAYWGNRKIAFVEGCDLICDEKGNYTYKVRLT